MVASRQRKNHESKKLSTGGERIQEGDLTEKGNPRCLRDCDDQSGGGERDKKTEVRHTKKMERSTQQTQTTFRTSTGNQNN